MHSVAISVAWCSECSAVWVRKREDSFATNDLAVSFRCGFWRSSNMCSWRTRQVRLRWDTGHRLRPDCMCCRMAVSCDWTPGSKMRICQESFRT